jgi:hypothetical protein
MTSEEAGETAHFWYKLARSYSPYNGCRRSIRLSKKKSRDIKRKALQAHSTNGHYMSLQTLKAMEKTTAEAKVKTTRRKTTKFQDTITSGSQARHHRRKILLSVSRRGATGSEHTLLDLALLPLIN